VGVTFAQKHQPASIIDITTVRSFRSPTTTFIDTSPPSPPPTQHYHITTYRAESYNLVSTAPPRTTTATTPSIITRSDIGSIRQR
jgi:hypothetical protein